MKTTVELPDHLLIEAKKRAAELRTTLRALIEAGLRRELAASGGAARTKQQVQSALEPLRGAVQRYDEPTAPVGVDDWEALS